MGVRYNSKECKLFPLFLFMLDCLSDFQYICIFVDCKLVAPRFQPFVYQKTSFSVLYIFYNFNS